MLNTARTVSKNTITLIAGSAVSQLLRVLYVSMLARYIGADGLGRISTATALVSLAMLIVRFGLDALVIREVASDKSRAAAYVTNVALVRFLLTWLLGGILIVIVSRSPYETETVVIIGIYAFVYAFDSFFDGVRAIFHAFQKMEYGMVADVARDLLNVVVSIVGISLGWSLVRIVSVSAIASLFKLVVGVALMQSRLVKASPFFDLRLSGRLLRDSLPFFVLLCISVAAERINIIVLSWTDTAESVGIYSAGTFAIAAILLIPGGFYQSIFPAFSHAHKSSDFELGRLYEASYKAMLVIGFPLAVGTILVSGDVIRLVFGSEFEGATAVMRILAIQLFTIVGYVNGAFFNATRRQTLFMILRGASVGLSAMLSFALIPRFGYIGAAVAVTVPAVIDFGLFSALCHRYTGLRFPWALTLRVGSSTGIMGVVVYVALKHGTNVLAVVPLGCLVYLLAVVALKAVSARERRAIGAIVFPRLLQHS